MFEITEIDIALETILNYKNSNEETFLNSLKTVAATAKNSDEILTKLSLDDWKILFSVLDSTWSSAKANLCLLYDSIKLQLPVNVKLVLVSDSFSGLESQDFCVRNVYVSALEELTKNLVDRTLDIIITSKLESLLKYYVESDKILENSTLTIVKYYVKNDKNHNILADKFLSYSTKVGKHAALRVVHLCQIITTHCHQFGFLVANNGLIAHFAALFPVFEDDALSSISLLDDLSQMAESSPGVCTVLLQSPLVKTLSSCLSDATHMLFPHSLKLYTHVYAQYFSDYPETIILIIELCLKTQICGANWPNVSISYQSLVYLLSNRPILTLLFENQRSRFENILKFLSHLVLRVPSELKGSFYETFSHIFSEPSENECLPLRLVFESVVPVGQLPRLVKTVFEEIQRAGLFLSLTISSHAWSVEHLIGNRSNILNLVCETCVFMHGNQNLELRNDLIKIFLGSPLFSDKITDEIRNTLVNILKHRSVESAKPTTALEGV